MATATLHFELVSTLLGMTGGSAGWGVGTALLRWLKL